MHTLLLVHTNRETRPTTVFPVGLLRVAEACEAAGIDTHVVDLGFCRNPRRTLAAAVKKHDPTAVGFSVRNIDNADYRAPRYYLGELKPLIQGLKDAHPLLPLIAGGSGVSMAPELCRRELGVHCVIAGPGEQALPALWPGLLERGKASLPKVVQPEPGPCAPTADVSRWLDLRPYRRRNAPLGIQARRGCPYTCVYCNYAAVEGTSRYEMGGVAEVVAAVKEQVERTGIRDVEFVDSTFNSPPKYAIELCEALARADLGLSLQASGITPRHGGVELLEAMRDAGFSAITCSPDTAAEATIESYGKGFARADLDAMARTTARLDLPVLWSLMFGGPGETQATVQETIRFVNEVVHPSDVVLVTTRMRVYPHTRLARVVADEGGDPPVLDISAPGQFYLSPNVDGSWLDEQLADLAQRRDNVMYMDTGQSALIAWVQRVQALVGQRGPTWAAHPAMLKRRSNQHV